MGKAAAETVEDVSWLTHVREVRHPLDQTHPLLVRHVHLTSGPPLPHPSVPFPEKHPYCEIGINLAGRITQFIGVEKVDRKVGDLIMMGPGTPHYAIRRSYPQSSVTIHFLPILLLEMGPEGDGARVLARFTAPQGIKDRVIRPPADLTQRLVGRFKEMASEFDGRKMGAEFRLRSLLMEALIDIIRWEESTGRSLNQDSLTLDWGLIEKALRYMHEHFAEPLYIEAIAKAVGLSVSRLQTSFREALGISCMHYLKALRISQAKALLCDPNARVIEVSLAVGFETLSHFNTSFRSMIGMSPTEYIRSQSQKAK